MATNQQNKKPEQDTEQLNQKIESIMGPTQSGERPVNDEKELYGNEHDDIKQGAPTLPSKEKAKTDPVVVEPQDSDKTPNGSQEEAFADSETAQAVDEIVAAEGDEVLQAEDDKVAAAFAPKQPKRFRDKVKDFFAAWWNNKKARWATIIGLILVVIAAAVIPQSRYFMLNTVGVRGAASLVVLDQSTQQPMRNAKVTIAGIEGQTDQNGYVKLERLKLGSTQLIIEKRAFAIVDKKITVGWGSNPLGDFTLDPVGVQYAFIVTDFLSGKPIEKAEAISGEASAYSNAEGKLVLTIDKNDADATEAIIKAADYRDEPVALDDNTQDTAEVHMVPGRKQVFVSKRSGKFDVYKIDVDGSNEQLVLAGSGNERDDMVLVPHPTANVAAFVATRDNIRNPDRFLLSNLMLLNVGDRAEQVVTTLGNSERYQLIGWIGDRLVYVQIAAGTSANSPQRHRLISYNYVTKETKELAASNYFNDVLIAGDTIYYAPSAVYQTNNAIGFFRIKADGTDQQRIFDKETWNIFRIDYGTLAFAIGSDWYNYDLKQQRASRVSGPPAVMKTRLYINSPDGKKSLWIDQRDGKSVLLSYDVQENKDEIIKTESGLSYPLRWFTNSTVVYRINTPQETADYVISLDGGETRKIRDVTNTEGIEAWYYY